MKKYFTLIEVLLSLAVFSFLLTLLFFWVRTFSGTGAQQKSLQGSCQQERCVLQQLQNILPKANDPKYFFTTSEVYSKTIGDTLVFTYDRGASLNPALSGTVLARLYVDTSHRLCLGIWPHPKHKLLAPSFKLCLLENVSNLSFSFYHPPNPFPKPVDPEGVDQPLPNVGFQNNWSARYPTLPAFVRIDMERSIGNDSYPLTFTFELLAAKPYIVYPLE